MSQDNPYQSPLGIEERPSALSRLWAVIEAWLWPVNVCERDGHDWEHDDFVWAQECRRCGKRERTYGM